MARRRYIAPPAPYPIQPLDEEWAPPAPSITPEQIERRALETRFPYPFEYRVIVPATGAATTTTVLVGDPTVSPAEGAVTSGAVPAGYRAFVDFISPYLDASGVVWTTPNLPGPSTVTWSVFVNGAPDAHYGTITQILTPWTSIADRAMIMLGAADRIRATITMTNVQAQWSNMGIRIKGWFVPLELKGGHTVVGGR